MPTARDPAIWSRAVFPDGELWLDLRAGDTARREPGADPPAPAGAVVLVDAGDPVADELPGRRSVSRALVWSLLDPAAAGRGTDLAATDAVAAEQALRREGARFWRGVARWRDLDPGLREQVARLLGDHDAAAAALTEGLERLAATAGAGPFATPPEAPPAPPAPVALDLPEDGPGWERWFQDPAGLGRLLGDRFRPRPGQGVMARDVAEALAAGHPLLLEAGTGVGKTLAYLLPLAAAVVREGGRGVVATHTLALQDQILGHDLPLLRRIWPDLTVRRLMGRTHYLCRLRARRFLAGAGDGPARDRARAALLVWLATTREGRREEVADHPLLRPFLRELFDSAEPCSPAVCHGDPPCYVQLARQRARDADLVVVNHALLLHDLAADRSLVGPYRHLVVDEAHRLPQVALDVHALRCDRRRPAVIEELLGPAGGAGRLPEVPRRLAERLARCGDAGRETAAHVPVLVERITLALHAYRAWLDALAGTWVPEGRELHRQRIHDYDETFGPVAHLLVPLQERLGAAADAWNRLATAVERLSGLDEPAQEALATLARCRELLGDLERDVAFLTGPVPEDWVFFLEGDGKGALRAVTGMPLAAGDLLAEAWREHGLTPVCTSATLGVAGDFSFLASELGLDRGELVAVTSEVPSPFRFDEQALVLSLPALPPPDGPHYLATVADLLRRLVTAVPRKAMALFTSYAHLEEVAARLGAPREGGADLDLTPLPGVDLLVQRPGTDGADLMRRFRRAGRALLLGTSTFWEGVDLPGEHLELLVVAKLPFLVPADPWVEARCEHIQRHGGQPFRDFMIRDAVLRLRQGVGRLIRDTGDRGVVLLLDSRLHTKGYGTTFLRSLPVRPRACGSVEEAVDLAAAFFADAAAAG